MGEFAMASGGIRGLWVGLLDFLGPSLPASATLADTWRRHARVVGRGRETARAAVAGRSARPRLTAPPRGLVVVARIVAATAAYLAVFFAGALLLYATGLVLVPAPAQGIFALVSLGLAEGAGL